MDPTDVPSNFEENLREAESTETVESLGQQLRQLRLLLTALLAGLIVLCLGVGFFFWRQTSLLRLDLQQKRPAVNDMVRKYQDETQPLINSFLTQLTAFARTNADFRPILDKYHIRPATNMAPRILPVQGAPPRQSP